MTPSVSFPAPPAQLPAARRPIDIVAPMTGITVPLATVPDPVFAQGLVGKGVSLDPTSGLVVAPVAGEVVQLHRARHALTIRTPAGVDLMVHVGVNTVDLKGEGFRTLVAVGDVVQAGQPVVEVDLDAVGTKATSLLTQILVTNAGGAEVLDPMYGEVVAGQTMVFRVADTTGPVDEPRRDDTPAAEDSRELELPNQNGLHARPAAVLAGKAREFRSTIYLRCGEQRANAKSMVAIMGLGTRQGDRLLVSASGDDASAAVGALAALIASGCGEAKGNPRPMPAPLPAKAGRKLGADNEFLGEPAAGGVAVGTLVQLRPDDIAVDRVGQGVEAERARFTTACAGAIAELEAAAAGCRSDDAKIVLAHRELLHDPKLLDETVAYIREGVSAGFAWRKVYQGHALWLEAMESALMRERATDLRDVGRRVLLLLEGAARREVAWPDGTILVAEHLAPSDLLAVPRAKLAGVCSVAGGPTGHVAIIARSLAVPAICGIERGVLQLATNTPAILDGTNGVLRHRASAADLAEARRLIAEHAERRARQMAAATEPAVTTDGHRVAVWANVGGAEEITAAMATGAEGVGLLRSEFLFQGSVHLPSEDEQAAAYLAAAAPVGGGRTLIVRTLDVGGDKPLPYLPLPAEENPFLGLRGIRVSLGYPEMFRTQIRAILRASSQCLLHIMFPMIATVAEFRRAKQIVLDEVRTTGGAVKIGVMIETPAAAVMADALAREADFFSIGTNDLTQYTLAMDRGHPHLAGQVDALDPAVLAMIRLTVAGAHRHGKHVGVCGAIAADLLAIPALIGLGVDELSIPGSAIPEVKTRIRGVSKRAAEQLVEELLECGTAAEVRARLAR